MRTLFIVLASMLATVGVATSAGATSQHVGTIVVKKDVVGNPGNDRWTILVNGQSIGTVGNGESLTFTADEHGEDTGNTVSEVPVAGNAVPVVSSSVICVSDLEGVVATNDSTSTLPGDVSLKNGETVTCTFTNTVKTTPPPPPPPPVHHHKHHHKQPVKHHVKLPPPVTLTPQQIATGATNSGG